MGPFFWRLAQDLRRAGTWVTKVNFCAGDALFFPGGNTLAFRGSLAEWPEFFVGLVARTGVDAVVLFGDCRPYHAAIRERARMLNVPLYVFEEGYLRPDYVTLERCGVNAYSAVPRDPAVLCAFPGQPEDYPPPRHPRHAYLRAVLYSSLYGLANFLGALRYPRYTHHRDLHPLKQGALWLWGWARKGLHLLREWPTRRRITTALAQRYFLVPLQVHNDAQVTHHSSFASVEDFITEVLASFAQHAPAGMHLVFKHHPMDRAYRNYRRLIARLARAHGVGGRVLYVHDMHLPKLFDRACGTVVINSTMGISSMVHSTPVKPLGRAMYDIPGLTFQGSLAEFWQAPGKVDGELFRRFRAWLLQHNQINGNFYRPLPDCGNQVGMRWFASMPSTVVGDDAAMSAGAACAGAADDLLDDVNDALAERL